MNAMWLDIEAEERRRRFWQAAGWIIFSGFVGVVIGYAWRVVQTGGLP